MTQAMAQRTAARLICDFQVKVGPLMVDTFDDLMVYFLEAEIFAERKAKDVPKFEWILMTNLNIICHFFEQMIHHNTSHRFKIGKLYRLKLIAY